MLGLILFGAAMVVPMVQFADLAEPDTTARFQFLSLGIPVGIVLILLGWFRRNRGIAPSSGDRELTARSDGSGADTESNAHQGNSRQRVPRPVKLVLAGCITAVVVFLLLKGAVLDLAIFNFMS